MTQQMSLKDKDFEESQKTIQNLHRAMATLSSQHEEEVGQMSHLKKQKELENLQLKQEIADMHDQIEQLGKIGVLENEIAQKEDIITQMQDDVIKYQEENAVIRQQTE